MDNANSNIRTIDSEQERSQLIQNTIISSLDDINAFILQYQHKENFVSIDKILRINISKKIESQELRSAFNSACHKYNQSWPKERKKLLHEFDILVKQGLIDISNECDFGMKIELVLKTRKEIENKLQDEIIQFGIGINNKQKTYEEAEDLIKKISLSRVEDTKKTSFKNLVNRMVKNGTLKFRGSKSCGGGGSVYPIYNRNGRK